MTITYKTGTMPNTIAVRLDGKVVGTIQTVNGFWQYWPKGSKTGGELFPSLAACEKSLGDPEPESLWEEQCRVFGECGGVCGDRPCVEWNKAHGERYREQKAAKSVIHAWNVPTTGALCSGTPESEIRPWGYKDINCPGCLSLMAAEERTRIGNTPMCDDCHREMDHCICGDLSDQETPGTFIDITPESCKTPEGVAKVNVAMKAFEESREEVARLATALFRNDTYVMMMRSVLEAQDEQEALDLLDSLSEAVEARLKAQEAFLRAVAGR